MNERAVDEIDGTRLSLHALLLLQHTTVINNDDTLNTKKNKIHTFRHG